MDTQKKNQNYSVWVEAALNWQVERTNRVLEDVCKIYLDVWKKMGNTESADFFRAFGARTITAELRPRISKEEDHWNRSWIIRNGCELPPREQFDAQLAWFRRSMEMLEGEWKRECESRAIICEAKERTTISTNPILPPDPTAITSRKHSSTHIADPRKETISKICAGHPEWNAQQICVELDRRASRNSNLSPLSSWSSRLWVDARKSHRATVDRYISRARKAKPLML